MSFDKGTTATTDDKDVKPGDKPNGSEGDAGTGQKVFLIVGERAYKDAESVAKKIEHADAHIATLEKEREAERVEAAKLKEENERLKKIADAIGTHTDPGKAVQTAQPSKEELVEQAAQLAAGILESNQTVKAKKANLDGALQLAQATYGEKFNEVIAQKAKALNLTLKAVDALAEDSPAAFAELFIEKAAKKGFQPSSGNVSTASLKQEDAKTTGKNITKMRERERVAYVQEMLKSGT